MAMKSLKEINLSCNPISDVGAKKVHAFLINNHHIEKLHLSLKTSVIKEPGSFLDLGRCTDKQPEFGEQVYAISDDTYLRIQAYTSRNLKIKSILEKELSKSESDVLREAKEAKESKDDHYAGLSLFKPIT